jgi:hypothetical protein
MRKEMTASTATARQTARIPLLNTIGKDMSIELCKSSKSSKRRKVECIEAAQGSDPDLSFERCENRWGCERATPHGKFDTFDIHVGVRRHWSPVMGA